MENTTPIPKWAQPKDLSDAKRQILHLARDWAEYTYRIGKILIWVKGELPHGAFIPWIEENVPFTRRTATNFMRFAERCDEQGLIIEYHPSRKMGNDFPFEDGNSDSENMKTDMKINEVNIISGDAFELIKDVPECSIDLVITSPPYADVKSYGDEVNVFRPDRYNDWLLPLFDEIWRVLKPSGSFILNIDDKCVNRKRHTYVLDIPGRAENETILNFYDYYIWDKTGFVEPSGGQKRLNHNTELLYHFCKDTEKIKWRMDRIREPYTETTYQRATSPIAKYAVDRNGERKVVDLKMRKLNPHGKIPGNIVRFPTNRVSKETCFHSHPATYNVKIPQWFIKALTDPGDTVLDPFMGSGTTAVAAISLGRKYLGFEINETYVIEMKRRIAKCATETIFPYAGRIT